MRCSLATWASTARSISSSPLGRELHQRAAGVGRVGQALNPALGFELGHAVRHGARGDHERREQRGRCQAIGRAAAAQRGQHVELPTAQVELGKGLIEPPLQQHRAALDAPDGTHGAGVQVGALALPLGQDGIDGIGWAWGGHTVWFVICLDFKIVW